MAAAEVRLLGPIEVVGEDGVVVALASKQTRLLAALTLADGRTCSADELVEALWTGPPPATARKLVQVYVSQLRKALPNAVGIATRGGAYALEAQDGVIDAARFERLLGECGTARRAENPALAASLAEQALSLWRGRAFGELAYEEFARAGSERLEELRLVALEERLDAQLALGHQAEALGETLALAEENPFRERAQALAMLALYRCGRQTDALEHFAGVRTRLRDELGLEPGPALRELQGRILRQDAELAVAADARPAATAFPVSPNPLVGRERELDDLHQTLTRRDERLIVLTGAGGSGKTRLALEAARHAAGSFANGAVLVELAPLRDSALVLPTIGSALGVADDPAQEPVDALATALASRELLLLVDNAEHVREAAASFAQLVARAPRLTILVTSRAVLHVSGERVIPVGPLDEDDAVELFLQRARLLDSAFALTPETEADVREICRRVDCLPLAVELAAARIRTLTPRALRERLDSRLGLLTGGPRDLPARQQTLLETIAWSVELLGQREREVFARLAVFPGGAMLEAAETVCGADVDVLATLVDDHLVHRDDVQGEPRFGMLETVREYALELSGEQRADVELALADYLAQLVDDLRLSEGTEREWRRAVDRLDPEIDNARVGLAAAAASGEAELEVRLAGGLWRYWWVRGSVREGIERIDRALAAGDGAATAARARALYGGAGLAWSVGDLERAKDLAGAAVSVAVAARSSWYELSAHTVLGHVANDEGDRATARRHYERSLELKEQLGLETLVEKINLAEVAHDSGEYETAKTLCLGVLDSDLRDDYPSSTAFAHLHLGRVYLELGDRRASLRHYEEARACFEELGFRSRVAYALQGLAAVKALEADFEEAARLLGQARRELDYTGTPEDRVAPEVVAATKARVRKALGDEAFEAAYAGSGEIEDGS